MIEEMMKIIEMQRAVISEELMKAKRKAQKAKSEELKVILDEMLKLAQLNDKLQFAEESVDRLEIALKQMKQKSSHHQNGHPNAEQGQDPLITDHLACAKDEVSRLRSANDQAALEVKDNQKALDAMEQSKAERKQALKRLEYDVNVIEKEGRKLAKEYEKVLSINLDHVIKIEQVIKGDQAEMKKETTIEDTTEEDAEETEEEEIYTLLNSSSTSSYSSKFFFQTQCRNLAIFLLLRFYVTSILKTFLAQKLQFWLH